MFADAYNLPWWSFFSTEEEEVDEEKEIELPEDDAIDVEDIGDGLEEIEEDDDEDEEEENVFGMVDDEEAF